MRVAPLQVMSSFSLLQSPTRLNDLVQAAKDRGYQTIALTDRNVLYGTVAFYHACQSAGVTPIIGLTLTTAGIIDETTLTDWVFLAKDFVGYQHLMKLSTAYQTREDETPLKLSELTALLGHLMVLTPADSEVTRQINVGQRQAVTHALQWLAEAADEASVYLGTSIDQSQALRDVLKQVAADTNTRVTALDPVDYLDADDAFSTTVLRAIDRGEVIANLGQASDVTGGHWLRSVTELSRRYDELNEQELLAQTGDIADQCHVELQFKSPQLPQYQTPGKTTSAEYLRDQCLQGLRTRLAHLDVDSQAYVDRLNHELEVIHRMGFDDYFLIVWDVMNFAHRSGITTGPGRGSAAGSLVAYVLRITDVDPIAYGLLFERFLNEERAQMPDIDLDIPDNRREEVLAYVHQKYGHERVAQIITFGTLAAKQALRDVGRTFGLAPYQQDQWSKAIPNVLHITLREAYAQSQPLKNLVADSQLNRLLFETAVKLEGLPRHYSTHAAGIVLSELPLIETVPLQTGSEELLMTQYTKDAVEEVGLLKMDFLGLRNLSIMANTLRMIKQETGRELDLSNVDLNDPQTLTLFQRGETNGVFQFESSGIKSVLRQLKPDSFELVAAVNALYRPGPMQNIETFIKRKAGQEVVSYPDPSLAPILGPTYGILVYQEQVMQVASVMGGFTLGQADLLRRAMSKKKKGTMDAMQKQFLAGAKRKGYPDGVARQTYDYIERFANYGFNRSHAIAYSKMAFEMAYLKAHFPGPFYAALLNSVLNNPTKTKTYLTEAKHHGVQVLPPDINRSQAYFSLADGQLLFGLSSVRGVRRDFLRDVLKQRQQNGPFKDLRDFITRIADKWRKPELIAGLIYAGAFDQFGANRAELIAVLPELISSIELSGNDVELFASLAPKIKSVPDFPLIEKLAKENEYLGAYLSGHPVEQYDSLRTKYQLNPVSELTPNSQVSLLVYVVKIRVIRTKKGDQMAFLTANDESGDISITLFPRTYNRVASWLQSEMVILVRGRVEQRKGLAVIADQLENAADLMPAPLSDGDRWFLRLDAEHERAVVMPKIQQIIRTNPGSTPVILFEPTTDRKWVLNASHSLSNDPKVKTQLQAILGEANVVYQEALAPNNH
ncbi:DNA polymerase III subunit alpha [Levilactobacillus bambusae]|uniref:DNA polymerase III subunit alpha n=1 Tax=Levilactobacillus bambusae TaxID=2024736 RepID=A0A2V1N4W3_9LACO|nr:DNA polymerase III subunit alpha [Levilactobacillus bambusae]PWG00790.1 DNA polymerase III subunit alpha [Levilactobacillus bambusae]